MQNLKSEKRRRPAAGGNIAFNKFVEQLSDFPKPWKGKWKVSGSKGIYKGKLLNALKLLKPYLPPGFYPEGDLGRSVAHILERRKRLALKSGGVHHKN